MNLPKTKHVTSHLGILSAKSVFTHSTPISVEIDLKSSCVVNFTSHKSNCIYMHTNSRLSFTKLNITKPFLLFPGFMSYVSVLFQGKMHYHVTGIFMRISESQFVCWCVHMHI